MYIARYLVSGVDVWLNNPRRPLEASGTSGEKAGLNGAINFSILDGWWYEGYAENNGWAIGDDTEYTNYELQDTADSQSIYNVLENEIIPLYYEKDTDEDGLNNKWIRRMKNSIKSVGGVYNTGRMLVDYLDRLYVPQMNRINAIKDNTDAVADFINWENNIRSKWPNIKITPYGNLDELLVKAGNTLTMSCKVFLGDIDPNSVSVEVYLGKIDSTGKMVDNNFKEMSLSNDLGNGEYEYSTEISLNNGGSYGYTFRVLPKHDLLISKHDLSLCCWLMG